ncbi:hypothetical protein BD779DRAFT_1526953 [Infundibulicybe gibba]|nr:hypothetical protein BD779DRAFT_1526953 [Infundibulicybe gibba]
MSITREHCSPALFAFKSPQSLAILHLATWVFPPANTRLPNWTSFELLSFSNYPTPTTYTKRALTWLDETYSHSLDMVHQICLCLQDMEDQVRVDDADDNRHYWHGNESTAEAIKSLFDTSHPKVTQVAGPSLRRDIIALRYLTSATASSDHFIILEHLIRTLNSSRCLIHSSTSFESLFALRPFDTNREKENLELFTDNELDSIFKVLRAWMDQNPQDAGLPSHCWAPFASGLGPWYELDEALRRPPVHDFMAFLDSLFQMSEGVKFVCYHRPYTGRLGNLEQELDSFFKALYAWINRNPQDTESFIHCQTFLTSNNFRRVKRARRYQSFRDFEAFLATQITRSDEMGVS